MSVPLEIRKQPLFLLWFDIETTGTDPTRDRILEVSWQVTFFDMPFKSPAEIRAIRVPHLLTRTHLIEVCNPRRFMVEPVVAMHEKNGLLAELESDATEKKTLMQVEQELLELTESWPDDRDERTPLAGCSVGFDKGFLQAQMPMFHRRLSHRVFDATSLRLFAASMGQTQYRTEPARHRAKEDLTYALNLAREIGALFFASTPLSESLSSRAT